MKNLRINKIRSFRSLTVTLAIAFLVLNAVVLLIDGSLQIYFNFQAQRRIVAGQQRLIAQDAANAVKSFIQEKLNMLEAAVHLGILVNVRQEEQKLILEKLLGFEPAFRQLILLDAQKHELVRISRLSSLVSHEFTKQVSDNLFLELSRGKTYISPIRIDDVTSEPLVIIAVSVRDVFGDFKGILMAEINLKFMWDLVGSMKIGNKGLAYVVDRQGNLIAFGDISRVLKGENLIRIKEVSKFVKSESYSADEEASVSKGIHNSYVVATYVPLVRPNWAVVVELPVMEAYGVVIRIIKLSILIIFLSFILAIVTGIYLSRRITKPIISLRDATNKIRQGKLDARIDIKSKNEIGQLADAFNQMVEDLQKSTVSITVLEEEQKRFQDVTLSTGDWIWEIDDQGRFTYSSAIVEKILGYKPEEIIGKYFYDFFPPEDREEKKKATLEALAKKITFIDLINRHIRKDGQVMILEASGVPLLNTDGDLMGYRGAARDITERKRKEEELKAAYEQLKATQAQLVQSAKMASIGLLAGGVAHEINNPLTGVLNNVQLIKMIAAQKKDFKLEEFKELLDLVEESAQRCTKITHSLLGFSRASKGAVQSISLNEMIEKVVGLLEDELITQNISIYKELNPALPLVKGDSQLLQQVIFDIVTNARWAIKQKTEHRGGTISIKTVYKADNNCVFISISDTGIGIPKENINKIFEPFFTTKPIGEGTGLGLSIVYNIIKEHNGTITVESQAGQGTTFKICLPAILA